MAFRIDLRTELMLRLADLPHDASPPRTSFDRVPGDDLLPCAVFDMTSVEVELRTAEKLIRDLRFNVIVIAKKVGATDALTVAEEMSEEVEARMAMPFEGLDLELESLEYTVAREGERPFPAISLAYRVQYETELGTSERDER